MRLKDTVTRFSTEPFIDAFDPVTVIYGRMNPFSEVANSGDSARRRILEVAPSVTIPLGLVLSPVSGENILVGDANYDFWHSEVIRHKHSTIPVTGMASVGSIGSVLEGTADSEVYFAEFFVKREGDAEEMADDFLGFEIYFPRVKQFSRGSIVKFGDLAYRLKTDTWIDSAGFSVAKGVKVEAGFRIFDVKTQKTVYDPITDSYSEVTVLGVDCFVEDLSEAYEFVSPSFTSVEPGDTAITILKSVVDLSVNDEIGEYRVQGKRDESTWATYQCRRLS